MMEQIETEFNLDKHLISLLQDAPFFAELSRYVRKVPTGDLPTAGVAYDQRFDDLTLYWNPAFFASLGDGEIRGVLVHEFYHLIFCHLTSRRKDPPRMWNVATDLAINSIICNGERNMTLPSGCLLPGVFPKGPDGREPTKEERAAMPIGTLIASFPKDQASEWYFEKLKDKVEEEKKKAKDSCPVHGKGQNQRKGKGDKGDPQNNQNNPNNGNQGDNSQNNPEGHGGDHIHGEKGDQCTCCGEDWLDSMDDHSGWEQIPEEMKDIVKGKIAAAVERAVKHADGQANGWGNIPAELRDAIRRSVTNIVDWRSVLRQFVGSLERGSKSNSIKRINKRYPYIHPGTKRGYTAKLLVAIDQSGSVDDGQLALFFSELASLTKRVSVTVLPFDCTADLRDSYEWRKGTKVEGKRVRGGGTDFNAPTRIVNDPKNRGKWDGMLVLTDGECEKPGPSRVKRGWIVSPGHKLLFSTDEVVVNLDPAKKSESGAWR